MIKKNFIKLLFSFIFFHLTNLIGAQSIYSGYVFSLALCNNGTLISWGDNAHGQLGDGTTLWRYTPVSVIGISNVKLITGGLYSHSVALKNDGTLWAWGRNFDGEIGNGTNVNSSVPVQIGSDNDWIIVSGGGYHTAAIKTNGKLWAWGQNWYGQLGDGTTINKYSPVQIGNDSDWVSVSAMGLRTFAIKSNGTLWSWGDNPFGQLGNGTTNSSLVPGQVGNSNDWLKIGGGYHHTFGIKSNGSLWAWGMNSYGELGDGTQVDKYSPAQIGNDTNWIDIGAGMMNSIAMKSDGTIWTCGKNHVGQLGNGTFNGSYLTFAQVTTATNWVGFSAGGAHILALKSDSSLWSWGWNTHGQLGDGTNIDNPVPQQLNGICPVTTTAFEQYTDLIAGIFPNPFKTNFTIKLKSVVQNGKIEISNILGEKVFVTTIFNQEKISIELENIPNGIYFVKVFVDKNQYSGKIIINN